MSNCFKQHHVALTLSINSIGVYRVWWENLREGDHLEDPGIDERIILK
jgi:hypothetical protein